MEIPLKTGIKKMLGNDATMNAVDQMATKLAARLGVSPAEGRNIIAETYNVIIEEFLSAGIVRLPYGLLLKPESKVRESIKEKYRCSDPTTIIPANLALDPPYTLFHPLVITAIMALQIKEELRIEGIDLSLLAQSCLYGAR